MQADRCIVAAFLIPYKGVGNRDYVVNPYLTESVVIVMRWRVCIAKHVAVRYGKIVNSQIRECHPILQQDLKTSNEK